MLAMRDGQSLIESCLTIFLICLIFAGLFQLSQVFAAREILDYASICGARAKTVGFNRWMVRKVVRSAAIANAGKMIVPELEENDSEIRELVAIQSPHWLYNIAWTPDGEHLLFTKQYEEDEQRAELWRVSVATGQEQDLGLSLQGDAPGKRPVEFDAVR